MLKGGRQTKFLWTDKAEDAFESLNAALVSAPIMAMPNEHGIFVLDTDASQFAIGAVLNQVQNGVERVIAYGSKRMKEPK